MESKMKNEKIIQQTMDLQREITREKLTRRDLLKMGMLSAATGMLLPISGLSLRAAWAKDGGASGGTTGSLSTASNLTGCPVPGKDILSPPTRPWVVEMPRLVEKQTVLNNDPANFEISLL
jgi:hypothetical protein